LDIPVDGIGSSVFSKLKKHHKRKKRRPPVKPQTHASSTAAMTNMSVINNSAQVQEFGQSMAAHANSGINVFDMGDIYQRVFIKNYNEQAPTGNASTGMDASGRQPMAPTLSLFRMKTCLQTLTLTIPDGSSNEAATGLVWTGSTLCS
jgi:hypothetical protein